MTIVFEVFNICLAIVLLLVVALPEPDFWKSEYVRGWEAWLVIRNILNFGHAAALLITGLGLILWQPWGRLGTIGLCIFAIVMLIVELPLMARIELPYETKALETELIADGMAAADAQAASLVIMIAVVGGALFFGLLMIVAQLLYFTRPKVIEAFRTDHTSH